MLADALLRRQNLDEFSKFLGQDAPAHADVAVERQGFVLRGYEDAMQARVDAVAESEIDDPVRTAEKHRWFGAVSRQRVQPLAGTARKQNDQRVVDHD